MINGVAISYGDIAVGAKESFVPSASDEAAFSKIAQLQHYNLIFPSYGNPCEGYSVTLDGGIQPLPKDTNGKNIGYVSSSISGEDGSTNVVITLQSEGLYSSQGFTFTFDTDANIYATELDITWYRVLNNTEVIASQTFNPDDSTYFCKKYVENFNKVVISFKKMNMPNVRLKLRAIDFGYGVIFYGDQLKSATQTHIIDPISSTIPINPFSFTLESRTSVEYKFQSKQPVIVAYNGKLISTNFVKGAKRIGRRSWEVETEDYIGIMEKLAFPGGVYYNKNAAELMAEIFDLCGIPYEIDEELASMEVSGYIPYTTAREALMHVAFAVQGVSDTSGSDRVRIRKLSEYVSQTIPTTRILQGQSFEEREVVTGVAVTVHTFKAIDTEDELYRADDSGTGEGIFVKFDEPYHGLNIINGEITAQGDNYAVFNARNGCVLKGKKYEHKTAVRTKKAEVISADTTENIKSISTATLVSSSNVDSILSACLDYFTRPQKISLSIVEGIHVKGGGFLRYKDMIRYSDNVRYGDRTKKVFTLDAPVSVGDLINAETEYLNDVEGRVVEQRFNLSSGNLIKETILI